jgi:hypothetical protein
MPRGRGRASRHTTRANSPLTAIRPTQAICLELPDYSCVTRSAVEFFGSGNSANPQAQAARLAGRRIQVWLTAIPMSAAADGVATPLSEKLRSVRSIQ